MDKAQNISNRKMSLLMLAGASQQVATDDQAAWKHVAVTEVQRAGLCSALLFSL